MFFTSGRLDELQRNLGDDLLKFAPELVVCAGVLILLGARLIRLFDRSHLGPMVIVILATSFAALLDQVANLEAAGGAHASRPYFESMLVPDRFAAFARGLVLLAALLTVLLTQFSGIPDAPDSGDFHALILGGTLGMMLMASAGHLLMVFIAVEMASLPSYALAGFLKGRRTGSEAALKYVIYGAGASGIMLYGITLIAGTFGTGILSTVANEVAHRGLDLPVLAGFSLLLVGLGFKLAAVPFHFWCPDVFEGAAAEVGGFLSVASKSAAIALVVRILATLQALQTRHWMIPESLGLGVGIIAVITITFGNLAAFNQTNLKRLLAYSTIAHAGYMLLAVATITTQGISSALYYLLAYIVMNLGAFAVVAVVRTHLHSEDISAFRGLVRRSPVLAITLTVFLLSLLGLPPLAGFAGKFQVFEAVYQAGRGAMRYGHSNLGTAYFILFGIAAVNTAISAYYYLRVVRAMLLDDPTTPSVVRPGFLAGLYLSVLSLTLFALGLAWDPAVKAADGAAMSLLAGTG